MHAKSSPNEHAQNKQPGLDFERAKIRLAEPQETGDLWKAFWGGDWRNFRLVAIRRAGETILVVADPAAEMLRYSASDPAALHQVRGSLLIFFANRDGRLSPGLSVSSFKAVAVRLYLGVLLLTGRLRHNWPGKDIWDNAESRFDLLRALTQKDALIDPAARAFAQSKASQGTALDIPPPFDSTGGPAFLPKPVNNRSVLFAQPAYYNFFYLAKALRKRGWDAVALCTEAPDSPHRRFYHGEDLNIHSADPVGHRRLLKDFFGANADRFGIVHTYGAGVLSLFAANHDVNSRFGAIPWDILEWKRRGTLIGYSHCGCLDGVSQSSFRAWSPTMCANCIWEDRPDVCSNERNLAWGRKINTIADLYCSETDPPLDYKAGANVFRAPLTFAIDPDIWRPDLVPPEHLKRQRNADEILVYAALGNYETRSRNGRDVKGTGAIQRAISQLQAEGINIKLDFVHNVPSIDNRYVQVQADIIVDQLNYGRYGALAREGMMLGKPVVGRVNKDDGGRPATQCILETPIVNADEQTIADVLRDLAVNPSKREEIGRASRDHAIKWWSADRLAERFEFVYDHLRKHGVPPEEDAVP